MQDATSDDFPGIGAGLPGSLLTQTLAQLGVCNQQLEFFCQRQGIIDRHCKTGNAIANKEG
jgi:hypothetical protein